MKFKIAGQFQIFPSSGDKEIEKTMNQFEFQTRSTII